LTPPLPGGSPGNSGGQTIAYTGITPTTTWSKVYWGVSTASGSTPQAGLDNALHPLTFQGFTSTTATWQGLTSWFNPDTSSTVTNVPIRMVITITSGPVTFVQANTLPSLDPGPGTGMGAAVNNPTKANFNAKVEFFADPTKTGTFIPINNVRQGGGGGSTRSSVTLAFYTAQ
jgi:hypothetical protein